MDRSYCEVCKVPLKRRQMDASSSFINVNSLPEEELDIAIRNQELLVPLRMQVAEYTTALAVTNNRPKTPTMNTAGCTLPQDTAHLDLLIKNHGIQYLTTLFCFFTYPLLVLFCRGPPSRKVSTTRSTQTTTNTTKIAK